MFFVRFLLVLALLSLAHGIYESQLGEFDWLRKNMGTAKHVVHARSGERMYAITEDSVLACIDTTKGDTVWRVVLPENAQFEQIAVSERDSKLYTVTRTPCGGMGDAGKEACFVYAAQAFELSDGVSLWDTRLGTDNSASAGLVDMAFLPSARRVGVVAKNSLYLISAATGKLLHDYLAGSKLRLAQVAVSSRLAADAGADTTELRHVAVGCVANADDAVCGKVALVHLKDEQFTVTYFAALSGNVKPSELSAQLASTGATGYANSDTIFGVTSTGLSHVALGSGKIGSVAFDAGKDVGAGAGANGALQRGSVVLVDGQSGDAVPAAWRCGLKGCQVLSASSGSSSSKLSAIQLAGCSGSAAAVGFDRVAASATVANRVMCVAVSEGSNVLSTVSAVPDSTAAQGVRIKEQELSTGTNFPLTSVAHVSLLSGTSKNGNSRVKAALIVGSAGSTGYFVPAKPAAGSAPAPTQDSKFELKWLRQEALARITEAALVSPATNEAGSTNIEITQFVGDLIGSANQLLEAVADKLLRTVGFRIEESSSDAQRKRAEKISYVTRQSRRFGFEKLAVCVAPSKKDGRGNLVASAINALTEEVVWLQELPDTAAFGADALIKLVQHSHSQSQSQSRSLVTLVLSTAMTTRMLVFNVESGVVSSDTSLQLGTLGVMSLADEPVLLLEAGGEKGAERTVLPLQAASAVEAAATAGNSYVYHVDRASGVLQTYRVGNASTAQVCSAVDNTCEARFAFATSPIATAVFPPSAEQIVDVTFPTAADAVAGRTKSLADDSVMLKYTNRNVALVTTQSVTSEQLPQPMLHVTLVDTVSGKIIYRSAIESGSTPVHAALVENTISVFYWNTKAKRTELSSVHLYEGMVDKHGLTPFASKHSAATATKYKEATTFSSFLSVPPLAMQKTYVMPRAVTAVHHTTTTHGISNKNLLVAMSSGQVYMVDSRQISPRRPTSEPSQFELQDGLQQFTPFLMLNPLQCITHNYAMGSGAKRILSAPSLLESSSMVLSYGHPDVHFNRVLPSADFDLLGADFNYPLLTLLLAILGALVWYLQRMQRNKHIRTMWE